MDLTFNEFQQKQKSTYKIEKYFDVFACILLTALSLIAFITFRDILNGDFLGVVRIIYCIIILSFVLGVYGLSSLKSNYQTHNYLKIQYWKSWWTTPYEVMLFADENLISFYINYRF